MLTLSVSKKGVALIVRALGGYIAAKGTVQAYAASKNETVMIVRKQNSSRGLWCIWKRLSTVDTVIGGLRNTRQRYWVEQMPAQPSRGALKSVTRSSKTNVA
jgi:hypothetical protein